MTNGRKVGGKIDLTRLYPRLFPTPTSHLSHDSWSAAGGEVVVGSCNCSITRICGRFSTDTCVEAK